MESLLVVLYSYLQVYMMRCARLNLEGRGEKNIVFSSVRLPERPAPLTPHLTLAPVVPRVVPYTNAVQILHVASVVSHRASHSLTYSLTITHVGDLEVRERLERFPKHSHVLLVVPPHANPHARGKLRQLHVRGGALDTLLSPLL
eukprot:1176162-Prorocentrum_minimum.AAC.1